ncbi:LysE family translocator [Billgrantia endophytica]|uniref:LysE family translocator n=1 Tax=Billgrantia endophytica TaxID=2033802 RepID=A0A2N7U2F7_9GAMM|nr:LysE family translocator [Halomonas endophytica]PMR74626.1 LysE family translocator [Halomonas endophytica]
MFSYAEWVTFLTLAVAATLSPGPAVLLAVRNGAQIGFKRSLSGITGNVCAMLTYALLATIGVAVVFSAFPMFAFWAQVLGGGYLIFLGLKLLLSRREVNAQASDLAANATKRGRLFAEAYLVGLSNPKALLFYSALFPQFVKPGELILIQSTSLALTFAFCSFTALCIYSWLASRVATRLSSGRAWSFANQCSGIIFMGLGGGLIFNSTFR